MEPEIKTKWLEALRSGQYKQCTGVLQKDGAFCCVGVLCDLIDSAGWENLHNERFEHHGAAYMPREGFFRDIGLPQEVVDAAVNLNDTGVDFLRIANYLELKA